MPEPAPPCDVELVRRLRSGDGALASVAFEELYQRYGALVLSIAHSVTGDSQGARDVCQNTFLKVLTRIDTLVDAEKLRSWLGHIARTTAIDWVRRRKHLKISLDDLEERRGEEGLDPGQAAGRDPAEEASTLEARRLILQAIDELPRRYREVLSYKHIAEMSYVEISETLGITISAVESRLYRARALLRRHLEKLHLLTGGDDLP